MAMRRRHKRTEQSKIDATPPWEIRHRDEPEPTSGPYDELDAPDDGLTRVDLGALRVPVRPGMEMRLDMNEAQQVIGVTLVNRQRLAAPDDHRIAEYVLVSAAVEPSKAKAFEDVFRKTVVVRGREPLPV